ncbi:MAG TPA: UDP-glucose/GDP-mannose dehydrogenase family protein [Gemmatimonadaceae bacterium]|nr:UDP-glucose/GDP-mannose dehydrogenase family protein [Gemmatimonadaceae bacterium]
MNVSVIGSGYVGLVVGACLAETGNTVCCADIDKKKIDTLRKGVLPIYEPGLETLVQRNQKEERLRFTTDLSDAIKSAEVLFIAVGTPPGEDGSADLRYVLDVAELVGKHMVREMVVVTKSTVPVGSAAKVNAAIAQEAKFPFHVCSNPEFLKEGTAVEDFMRPDRVILGVESVYARRVMTDLYSPFVRTGKPIVLMDVASAEMTKYAANGMLATRISFMNEIANLCDELGANVDFVRKGIGSDSRIGSAFLFPGPGYGGSCFPKDVKALVRTAYELGVPLDVLSAVDQTNERQKRILGVKIKHALGHSLEGKRIALWGLAFKAGTDDMREAPSLTLIEMLLEAGVSVSAHDPAAMEQARAVLADKIEYAESSYDALTGADALVVVTDWNEYRNPDFNRIKKGLSQPVIIDGRNLYDPERMRDLGMRYYSIGRPATVPTD